MKILVINCGSSSIKYQLFEMPKRTVLAKGSVTRIGEPQGQAVQKAGDRMISRTAPIPDHHTAFDIVKVMLTDPVLGAVETFDEIAACGHRVVHGGDEFTGSVLIREAVLDTIDRFSDLAPLHNPPNLTGIRAAIAISPSIPQVACFDTAFHQTIPQRAWMYGLPQEFYRKYRIRKYGFHGTSHKFVTLRTAQLLEKSPESVNLITCHLGNGCSVSAIRDGMSIDTSMGLTPLEGLLMGTRTGDLDPAIIFYLNRKGFGSEELDALFNKKSGLLGVSEVSNDLRDLQGLADQGHEGARLALAIFSYRVKKYIGAYFAALNGCDAIVFTAGIGENNPRARASIAEGLDALGITLDREENEKIIGSEGTISSESSRVKLLVIPTDEEAAIAVETYALVKNIP